MLVQGQGYSNEEHADAWGTGRNELRARLISEKSDLSMERSGRSRVRHKFTLIGLI